MERIHTVGIFYVWLLLVVFLPEVTTYRILFVPAPMESHVNLFARSASVMQDSGHEVFILTLKQSTRIVASHGIEAIESPTPKELHYFKFGSDYADMVLDKAIDFKTMFTYYAIEQATICANAHGDGKLIDKLRGLEFDIVIVDGTDYARCLYLIPYRLRLRYITLTSRPDPWTVGIPSLPSIEGLMGTGNIMTPDSSFLHRVKSLAVHLVVWYNFPPSVIDDGMIRKYVPDRPKTTFQDLFKKSEMWLVHRDIICLHQLVVFGYHYQYIPSLQAAPPKPLHRELEAIISSSEDGFVVFTLGSALGSIPSDMLRKALQAFSQVKFTVIMRHKGDISDPIPKNVKIMSWIPQNDLLGHPKALAFITHGGENGLSEALYHKVPLIMLPMFGDQPSNAEEARRKGFGVILDGQHFTIGDLVEAINEVAGTDQYRVNIKECSEKLASLRGNQPDLTFWMEHIVRFGSEHLKHVSTQVPIWKMFMLDIILVFVIVIIFLYTSCLISVRYIWRKFHHNNTFARKKENRKKKNH